MEQTKIVVPVPSYTDPSNPDGASGSVNLELDSHPMLHSEDYGLGYKHDAVRKPQDVHADESRIGMLPPDRGEWTKEDWKAQASAYGLHTSGNMDTLIERVETFEREQGGGS